MSDKKKIIIVGNGSGTKAIKQAIEASSYSINIATSGEVPETLETEVQTLKGLAEPIEIHELERPKKFYPKKGSKYHK